MPCGWEGNCRSSMALAMHQTSVVYPPTGSQLKEWRWAPCLHSSLGMAHFVGTAHIVRGAESIKRYCVCLIRLCVVGLLLWAQSQSRNVTKKYKHLGQKTAYLHAEQNNRLFSLKQLHNLDFRLHTVKTHTLYIARLLHSSRCGQCHVFSIRRWLNTDLFCLIYLAAVYCIAAADNCVCRLYCTTVWHIHTAAWWWPEDPDWAVGCWYWVSSQEIVCCGRCVSTFPL